MRPVSRPSRSSTGRPFAITFEDPDSRYLELRLVPHGATALVGIGLALLVGWWLLGQQGLPARERISGLILIALTGLYGLIALALFPKERSQPGLPPTRFTTHQDHQQGA